MGNIRKDKKMFDKNVRNAFQSFINNDLDRAKMQLGGFEGRLIQLNKNKSNPSLENKIRRVRFIYSGLFNKKLKK